MFALSKFLSKFHFSEFSKSWIFFENNLKQKNVFIMKPKFSAEDLEQIIITLPSKSWKIHPNKLFFRKFIQAYYQRWMSFPEKFSAKTVRVLNRKLKFLENIWMNFPGVFRKCPHWAKMCFLDKNDILIEKRPHIVFDDHFCEKLRFVCCRSGNFKTKL